MTDAGDINFDIVQQIINMDDTVDENDNSDNNDECNDIYEDKNET